MTIELKTITVLLVEDAAVMRNIEIKTLKGLGFEKIIEAEDGDVAIKYLEERADIDIVISDWNMPKMDGFALLEWIRGSKNYKDLPFIMATGQGDKRQQEKAAMAGVSSFIAKPFDSDELKKKIDIALGVRKKEDKIPDYEMGPQRAASGKVKIRVAHIQITDHLVLGVLQHLIQKGELSPAYFELETHCMSGWNPVADQLEKGRVDAACILAPIAMDLFSYNVPIKLVLLAHKNGSIFVRNKKGNYVDPYENFFKSKTFLIPHKLSIHHMLSHMFFDVIGLRPGMSEDMGMDVNFEVVPPVQMPEFLAANQDACGFMVAEPLGTKAIASGIADLMFLSGELWDQHPCCVVAIRDDFIGPHSDAVYEFTEMLVKAGEFIEYRPEQAAEVAVRFLDPNNRLGLKVPLLKNVLTEKQGIKSGDLFPIIEDFEIIQNYMVNKMRIGKWIDLEKFIDIRFAEAACKGIHEHKPSALRLTREIAMEILTRGIGEKTVSHKAMLNKEGKYLTFLLNNQEYGIDIFKVKEIIGMMPIRPLPQSSSYVKGVINLRDKIIPVIDLRLRFGMEEIDYTDRTCIIVLELMENSEPFYTGIVVDTVLEVINIKSSNIDDTPSFGSNLDTQNILAMAKMEGDIKILLDIDSVIAARGTNIL